MVSAERPGQDAGPHGHLDHVGTSEGRLMSFEACTSRRSLGRIGQPGPSSEIEQGRCVLPPLLVKLPSKWRKEDVEVRNVG